MFIKIWFSKFSDLFIENYWDSANLGFGQFVPMWKMILRNMEDEIEMKVQILWGSELWFIIITSKWLKFQNTQSHCFHYLIIIDWWVSELKLIVQAECTKTKDPYFRGLIRTEQLIVEYAMLAVYAVLSYGLWEVQKKYKSPTFKNLWSSWKQWGPISAGMLLTVRSKNLNWNWLKQVAGLVIRC